MKLESKPFQRLGSKSNTHAGREFEEAVKDYFHSSQGLKLERNFEALVGFKAKKPHKFDLGCRKPRILVECKSYKWTVGGNSPSAKIKMLNEAMLLFSIAPRGYRKILVLLKDMKGNQSLATHYTRTQNHLIPQGVEIWEFDTHAQQGRRVW